MLGDDQPARPPAGKAAQEAFVCNSLQLAVHAPAHRWTEADLGGGPKGDLETGTPSG